LFSETENKEAGMSPGHCSTYGVEIMSTFQ